MGWGSHVGPKALNLWDLTLSPGKKRQNWVESWDTQLVRENCGVGNLPSQRWKLGAEYFNVKCPEQANQIPDRKQTSGG